jgi:hypothetical protein
VYLTLYKLGNPKLNFISLLVTIMLRVLRGIWVVAAVALAMEAGTGLSSETESMARHNDDHCAPYQFEVVGFQTWKPDVDNGAHGFNLHFGFRENLTTVVTECNLNDTTHPEPGTRPDGELRFVCENPNVHFMWEDAGYGALTVIEQACPKQNGE